MRDRLVSTEDGGTKSGKREISAIDAILGCDRCDLGAISRCDLSAISEICGLVRVVIAKLVLSNMAIFN